MKYSTLPLETERLILKRGSAEDFQTVYEYDFRALRDISRSAERDKGYAPLTAQTFKKV
jgi:hypothetical protein